MPLANLITINKIITPWNIIWTGGGRGADQSNSCSNLPTCTWIYTVLINTGETLEKSGDKLTRIRISLSRRTTSVKFSVIRPYVIARTPTPALIFSIYFLINGTTRFLISATRPELGTVNMCFDFYYRERMWSYRRVMSFKRNNSGIP